MFTKLNITHTLAKKPYLELFQEYHAQIDGVESVLSRYAIDKFLENELLQIIPEGYRKYFTAQCIEITGRGALPHSHAEDKVVINFYVNPANGTTTGYKVKNNRKYAYDAEGQQKESILHDPNDLVIAETYLPKSGEIWVLDASLPHSVSMPHSDTRFMYSLVTDQLDYKTVRYILKKLIDA